MSVDEDVWENEVDREKLRENIWKKWGEMKRASASKINKQINKQINK